MQPIDQLVLEISFPLHLLGLSSMALPVVEFSRQGYKIGKVFAKKSTVVK